MSILKNIKKKQPTDKPSSIKGMLSLFLLFCGSIIFWELLMHLMLFDETNMRIFYVILFSVFFGAFFTLLTSFFGRIANKVLLWIFLSVLYLWYAAQLIYYRIFGNFISLYLVRMGGDAVTNFFKETVGCVLRNLWLLLILALPLVLCGILLKIKWVNTDRRPILFLPIELIVCVAVFFSGFGSLYIEGTGAYTVYDIYHNNNTNTDTSICNLGFLTTFRLELKAALFNTNEVTESDPIEDVEILDQSDLNDILGLPSTPPSTKPEPPDTSGDGDSEPGTDLPPAPKYFDQVMDIDFDALKAEAMASGNNTLASMHEYFAAQMPTKTNDYTGMFKGKNLIYLVCESFSPVVISEEMTPTLHKLYNEGIKFNNFYGTFRSVTTNGEYTACLGIFPDMSRSKLDGSFNASSKNYLPFALGNIFNSTYGIQSYGYHNYLASFYNRNQTHPNLGYSLKAMNSGLHFTSTWPSSDLEMMQQSVKDYVNAAEGKPFHAYYMTFSGHYEYNFEVNPIAKRNQEAVAHLPYSETVKAYIACNLELEKAMANLMEQLEAAGELEDTVIVMTTDHYPYGLTNKQYNELTTEKRNESFGIYQNAFICWSYGMEDPIEIDTPCCTVDILPTLLNLFGFEYDSRLLMGKDVLDPSSFHVAILHNGSFITDKVMFNATNGKTTYLVDQSTVSPLYVETVNKIVQNEFSLSTLILNNDYYRAVFKK